MKQTVQTFKRMPVIGIAAFCAIAAFCSCEKEEEYSLEDDVLKDRKEIVLTKAQQNTLTNANGFSLKLFSELNKRLECGNFVFSPFSLQTALTMTAGGASESSDTYKELMSVMGMKGMKYGDVTSTYSTLLEQLSVIDEKSCFKSANSMWINTGRVAERSIREDYKGMLKDSFNADITALDFDEPQSLRTINSWVEEKTDGKISDYLENLDPDTYVSLINAIFYSGSWAVPMYEFEDEVFINIDGSPSVQTYIGTAIRTKALEGQGFKAFNMYLGTGSFALTIFLPDRGGFKSFSSKFGESEWNEFQRKSGVYSVALTMPRFSERSKAKDDIIQTLKEMGVKALFNQDKGLDMILDQSMPLFVNEILQKSTLDLTEKGLDASSATQVTMLIGSGTPSKKPELKQMNVDICDPFIYVISETTTGAILFIGEKTSF